VDAINPRRKRTTEKHLETIYGDGNVDSGLRVELEEDGDGSAISERGGDEWSVACAPLRATKHK